MKTRLLFLIFFISILNVSFGQQIEIGTGTVQSGTTRSTPVNIWYRRWSAQMVYTAAEITAAGGSVGEINKLAFYVTNAPIYTIPGYEIKIKHTTSTNANPNFGNGGWTTVRSADDYLPVVGDWDFISFDTPFNWDGTSNIVIQICCSQVQPFYHRSGTCRIFAATNGYKYRWTDAAGNSCGVVPTVIQPYKPHIAFLFDTVTVWTGNVSTDWFNTNNWTAGVPTKNIDVRIPSAVPNYPVVVGPTAICQDLKIEGNFTVAALERLEVYGNFSNEGNFIDMGDMVSLISNKPVVLESSNDLNIRNLVLNNEANVSVTGGGQIIIGKELKVEKGIFNTNNKVTLRSDQNGTARIDELKSNCAYTLNMQDTYGDGWNGGFLNILVNGVSIGTFAGGGFNSTASFSVISGSTIQLTYTSGNWETENTYQLLDEDGATLFSDGTSPATGNVFLTTSSCAFVSDPIQGEITMERYIDAGDTYWRFFASAVQGATIGDYEGDFVTAGYPGSLFPNFPFISMYTYTEGTGYVPAAGTTQIIQPGQGLFVWSGDTITGTAPFLVDLDGAPNQGNLSIPVQYSAADGWNLIGNPYASTIDWDSPGWDKTNMGNAVYILNPDTEQYATYVNGASANGGSPLIASQQAFWVYTTGANPVLTAKESVKSSVDQAFFRASNSISPGMHIVIDGFDKTDECIMRHVDGTADIFESDYDAYKKFASWDGYPHVSILNTEDLDFTVHSFDKVFQEWTLPIRTVVFQSGNYDLVFNDLSEIDVPCMQLEDTYTGQVYPIVDGVPLNFYMSDTTWSPRFLLHIGKKYEIEVNPTLCYGSATGEFSIDLDSVNNAYYELSNSDTVISGYFTGSILTIDQLSTGTYDLDISGLSNICQTQVFTVDIAQPMPIVVSAVEAAEVFGGDGSIELSVNGAINPFQFQWSNGSNTINNYGLVGGDYIFDMIDSNGCSYSQTYTIDSFLSDGSDDNPIDELTEIKVNYLNGQIVIENFNVEEDQAVQLISLTGEIVARYQLLANQSEYILDVPNLANHIYLLQLKTKQIKLLVN